MRTLNLFPIALSFTLGASSLWLFKTLPNIPLAWFYSMICAGLCLCLRGKIPWPVLFFACSAGFFCCYAQSAKVIHHRLPANLEGMPLTVVGQIISIPEGNMQNIHFDFQIEKILSDENSNWPLPEKIRLSWFQNRYAQYDQSENLKLGDTWQFTVKLKQARSTFNPASFDYEAWLFSHQITAVGSIVDKDSQRALKLKSSFWQIFFDKWRENIANQLQQDLAGNADLGMIEALAIGVRDDLTTTQWQAMQATGTNHLVAIAGLHVGFVVAFVYALTKFIWRRFPRLMLIRPAHEAAIFFALLAAIYYSALAGFALPTKRALIMLTIALLANLLRRNLPPWQTLSAALITVLLYDSLSIFTETFWLSFVAVFVILFAINGRIGNNAHWQQSLRIQWIIAIGLAPITLYFFHQISLINLIANAIAIPWVAFLALPLILFGIILLPLNHAAAKILWWLAAKALAFYWPVLNFLASLDRLQWHGYFNSVWQFLLAMIGMIIFLSPKGFPCRYFGLFGFLPFIFPTTTILPPAEFKITQLDVGQGLSTLIQTAHHSMVFDTGPRLDDSYDMGQSVVVPALHFNRIKQLDLLVISHGDNDHSGGAHAVLQALPVKTLLTSVPALYQNLPDQLPNHLFSDNLIIHLQNHWPKPKVLSCEAGQSWNWDGVQFQVLNPAHDYQPRSGNDRSCVIRISNQFHSILLTGDIEKRTEKILLNSGQALASEVIVAPHHGSKTSSSEDFLQAIKPKWVFFATGYRNRFHFPNEEVILRYQQMHATSIDTAKDGEVEMLVPNQAQALTVLKTRAIDQHFWNFN